MDQNTEYKSTIKSRPFFYKESRKAASLMIQGINDNDIKLKSINENIFQVNTESRKREIASIVLKRLRTLDGYMLEKIVKGSIESSKIIVLISIMKSDRLFFEFMNEVFREKIILKDFYLKDTDFNIYFERKKEQSEKVNSWSDYTFYKLKQVYSRILYETGLIKEKKGTREILRPVMDKEFQEHLSGTGDEKYLKALLGEI
ncbi:MAG TPA: DUF1819 domain-containing protein [Clostridiaceae bacterium]|nr:DUF1819 domain-containing protein [Clostridiaceae bacterium]